ncbi:MAG: CHAT domain-containing protein [Spirulinaceae cyanobacterium RM2_2_10]|nr:CHAT domain-containing protein [Spirulinaceae cyanobacterium RM2_2_10]
MIQRQIKAVVGGISEARPGFAALPKVAEEIEDITETVPAVSLLNQEFTRDNFAHQVQTLAPNVVHLATHGQFGSSQAETFLLTWDGRLNVRELAELLQNRDVSHDNPLELLVLSACDTAAGDERAVLGIAGFAVRSGARSTVATLWPVRDNVAAEVMAQFYKTFRQPGITKVEALRRAQRSLLAEERFNAPFFWASFIVVGNWL